MAPQRRGGQASPDDTADAGSAEAVSGWWHRIVRPSAISRGSGVTVSHTSSRHRHRVRYGHPALESSGTAFVSPSSVIASEVSADAPTSAAVYGWAAAPSTSWADPDSTTLPRYITTTSWQRWRTRRRSWPTKRYVTPRRSWRSSSRLTICALTETSRAD